MLWYFLSLSCVLLVKSSSVPIRVVNFWGSGLDAWIDLPVTQNTNGAWTVTLELNKPVTKFQIWDANVIKIEDNNKKYTLSNKYYNGQLYAGATLSFNFVADISDGSPRSGIATLEGQVSGGQSTTPAPTPAPTTTMTTTPSGGNGGSGGSGGSGAVNGSCSNTNKGSDGNSNYLYNKVLKKSLLFYEAQRSGHLPNSNRISWRGDSALQDGSDNSIDLSGGWYDAGDHVKFNFPMAWSVTTLAWGLLQYSDAYQAAGQLQNALDSIKWPLDYLLKCHVSSNGQTTRLYGQVGNGHTDHAYWGRPEDMTMSRLSFYLSSGNPGSDLAAETAAAMAAASMVFKEHGDTTYANNLLDNAKTIYQFADKYRGKYSDSIGNAADFYRSWSGYEDELMWGAIWLYKATGDSSYLNTAKSYYSGGYPKFFSWDDKKVGAYVLLYEATKDNQYKNSIESFLNQWFPGGSIPYTPGGLAWGDKWGPNRYSANAAFIALVSADLCVKTTQGREFARQQISYMLGKKRSDKKNFIVGLQKSNSQSPERPHHRSSSCPTDLGQPCLSNAQYNSGPNPGVLNGALVGGPGSDDQFNDDRTDYITNEVACDYNAGFQSAVAGLRQLKL